MRGMCEGRVLGLFKSWPQHSTLRLKCHKRSQKRDLQREKLHWAAAAAAAANPVNPQESSYPSLAPWVFRSRFLRFSAFKLSFPATFRATAGDPLSGGDSERLRGGVLVCEVEAASFWTNPGVVATATRGDDRAPNRPGGRSRVRSWQKGARAGSGGAWKWCA